MQSRRLRRVRVRVGRHGLDRRENLPAAGAADCSCTPLHNPYAPARLSPAVRSHGICFDLRQLSKKGLASVISADQAGATAFPAPPIARAPRVIEGLFAASTPVHSRSPPCAAPWPKMSADPLCSAAAAAATGMVSNFSKDDLKELFDTEGMFARSNNPPPHQQHLRPRIVPSTTGPLGHWLSCPRSPPPAPRSVPSDTLENFKDSTDRMAEDGEDGKDARPAVELKVRPAEPPPRHRVFPVPLHRAGTDRCLRPCPRPCPAFGALSLFRADLRVFCPAARC